MVAQFGRATEKKDSFRFFPSYEWRRKEILQCETVGRWFKSSPSLHGIKMSGDDKGYFIGEKALLSLIPSSPKQGVAKRSATSLLMKLAVLDYSRLQ